MGSLFGMVRKMSRKNWLSQLYQRLLQYWVTDVDDGKERDKNGLVQIEDKEGFSLDTSLSDGSRLVLEGKPSKRSGLEIVASLYDTGFEVDRVTLDYDGSNHSITRHKLTEDHVKNRKYLCGEPEEFYGEFAKFISRSSLVDELKVSGRFTSSGDEDVDRDAVRDLALDAVTRSSCLLAGKYRDEFSALLAKETADYLRRNGIHKEISSLVIAGNLREAGEKYLRQGVENALGINLRYSD